MITVVVITVVVITVVNGKSKVIESDFKFKNLIITGQRCAGILISLQTSQL